MVATGTPQPPGDIGHIGPLPNISAATNALVSEVSPQQFFLHWSSPSPAAATISGHRWRPFPPSAVLQVAVTVTAAGRA